MKTLHLCCFFAEKMKGFYDREFNGRERKELLAKQEKIR